MVAYSFYGDADTTVLSELIVSAGLTALSYINTAGLDILIYFPEALSTESEASLGTVVNGHINQVRATSNMENTIQEATNFAYKLIRNFAAQNVLLGVTQANMTGTIINILAPTLVALQGGSLYEAINRLREVPPESYDATFITEPRILQTINAIESYLGIALSTEI